MTPAQIKAKELVDKSESKENINEDELVLAADIINSSKLKEEEKAHLLNQYKKGVMSLEDIKNYSGVVSSERLASGKLNKWDRAALYEDKQKNKKNKSSKDYVDFEEVDTDKKEIPQSNKQTVAKPAKVEKVAEEKMTREQFIMKYLGNSTINWSEEHCDMMRNDLDKVINYHDRQSEIDELTKEVERLKVLNKRLFTLWESLYSPNKLII